MVTTLNDIETRFDNAGQFIRNLDLSLEQWTPKPGEQQRWLFRGQGKAVWGLTPRAWRPDGQQLLPPAPGWLPGLGNRKTRSPPYSDILTQCARELAGLVEFRDTAGEIGLSLPPEEPTKVLDWTFEYCEVTESSGNPLEMGEPTHLVALAQHHGIPTRVLDWTWKPHYAAFFAAEDSCSWATRDATGTCPDLAVWAIDRFALAGDQDLRIKVLPRAAQSFMHAQDGAFMWDGQAGRHFANHLEWPDFALRILKGENAGNAGAFRKLVLKGSEAPALLDLLQSQRISRVHLMPTLDNVSRVVQRLRRPNQ